MAKQTVNIGSTANDGTGDQLRNAFDKLNQNNDEIYGNNFVTELMLNDNIVGADELKVTGDGAAGQILSSDGDGTMTWITGVTGDITGVEAGAGLTGGGTGGDVTLNVVAGTGITVAADEVALDTTVQDEITLNTAKTGITAQQATDITTNNAKVSDQTVVLNQGANVTITGTYPSFTIASDDVVGAVNSVNGDTGVVVLDTADIAENTNLYYTEARVTANAEVTANTAKTGITTQQASDITANNAKLTDQTVTLTDAGNITIGGTYPDFTIASADVTGAVTSVNGAVGVVVLDTADVAEDTNLYYTEARVAANSAVTANTAKDGFPGFGTTAGTSLEGDTALLQLGTSGTTALAGDTALLQLGTSGTTALAGDTALLQLGTSGTTALAGDTALLALGTSNSTALAGDTTTITAQQISDITDNNAKVTNATHTGDVTGDVALTIADDAVTTVKILDDNVTHAKLENRYTAINAIGTTSGAFNIDFSLGAVHTATLGGAHTGTFTNFKVGQVIDIIITGNHALTFSATASGTPAINKVGTTAYDGTATQIIQVQCASDDSTTPIFYYACNTYAVDTTP